MGEEPIWRTSSMEGKWMDGKGDVAVRRGDYYDKIWVDFRIMNMKEGKNQHTRHGLRLTVEQLRELMPRLREFLDEVQDELEAKERVSGNAEQP